MNDKSWIKLYRKTILNGILRDHPAWVLFTWMLLTCNRKGEVIVSRFTTANALKLSPSQFYRALKRLSQKFHAITVKSNNKYSVVQIVNWAKYQTDEPEANNKRTTSEQQANTYTRIENKNIYIPDSKNRATKNPSKKRTICPNPKGHQDCINEINKAAAAFGKNWNLTMGKQILAWHKMISAHISEEVMNKAANELDGDKFWANKGWDLMDLLNVISKGGKTYVSD